MWSLSKFQMERFVLANPKRSGVEYLIDVERESEHLSLCDCDDTCGWLYSTLNMRMSSKYGNAFCYILLINSHGHVNKPIIVVHTNQCLSLSLVLHFLPSKEKVRMHSVRMVVFMCTMTLCYDNLQLWIGSLICVQTHTLMFVATFSSRFNSHRSWWICFACLPFTFLSRSFVCPAHVVDCLVQFYSVHVSVVAHNMLFGS